MQLHVSLVISQLKYIDIKIKIKYFISFQRKPVLKIRNANVFSDFYAPNIYSSVSFIYTILYIRYLRAVLDVVALLNVCSVINCSTGQKQYTHTQ